jgi:hypothetical protein
MHVFWLKISIEINIAVGQADALIRQADVAAFVA